MPEPMEVDTDTQEVMAAADAWLQSNPINPPPTAGNNPPPAAGSNPPPAAGSNPPPAAGSNPPPAAGSNPASDATNLMDRVKCPLTLEMYVDPIQTPGGITYERAALATALQNDPRCPLGRVELTIEQCTANLAMKSLCETLRSCSQQEQFELMRTEIAAQTTEADLSRQQQEITFRRLIS
jgi:hypothetical protein